MLDKRTYQTIARVSDIVTGKDSAYHEGWNAYWKGTIRNPYSSGHWRRLDWEGGWLDAEAESNQDNREEEYPDYDERDYRPQENEEEDD